LFHPGAVGEEKTGGNLRVPGFGPVASRIWGDG